MKEDGTVELELQEYLKESIDAFGEDITRKALTTANGKLFEVNKESKRLNEK